MHMTIDQAITHPPHRPHPQAPPPTTTTDDDAGSFFGLQRGAEALRDAFQRYGHYESQLDPLGLAPTRCVVWSLIWWIDWWCVVRLT